MGLRAARLSPSGEHSIERLMRLCVFGLWHLGCVTAACLARGGHSVIAIDPDAALIARLRRSEPPLLEPGLAELTGDGLSHNRLRFEVASPETVSGAEVVWVTFDTPVDEDDMGQISAVVDPVMTLVPNLPDHCLVLVSSQLPIGTTRKLLDATALRGRSDVTFGYIPENLRLGKAIEVFTKPDRVVVGLQCDTDRAKVATLLAPFTDNIVWMSIESAEMTKHAINGFLATSVVFMNELATICEEVGADAKEVESGLKSEARIGPGAYLSPGGPFTGGTLARDVTTLSDLGKALRVPVSLISAVRQSNEEHRLWALRKLREQLGPLSGKRIAILGLTYKPGTSTLRRSGAVELAQALRREGATAIGFDPAVGELPDDICGVLTLASSATQAVAGVDAAVLSTPWPDFRTLDWSSLLTSMASPNVIDAGWFLAPLLKHRPDVRYAAVGHSLTPSCAGHYVQTAED
jgi:UDPglucose 6-dehydrogenase